MALPLFSLVFLGLVLGSNAQWNYTTGYPYYDLSTNTELASTPPSPTGDTDRLCGGNLKNLWLDVVIVVENTAGMTNDGLVQIAADASTVFLNGTRIGTGYSDPRNTRIGIVTYGKQATVKADLNQYQSTEDFVNGVYSSLLPVSSETDSYVATGLVAAENVLAAGRANGYRANYQRHIILYASAYKGTGENDPVPVADRIKSSGVFISTIAFTQKGDDDTLKKIGELASPGFDHASTDLNIVGEIQGDSLQANCYCQNLWTQYRVDVNNENSFKYGVCLRATELQAGGYPARLACQNMAPQGYLATEFDQQKHDYILSLVNSTKTISPPYIYFIGLTYVNGAWGWQQPAGYPLLPLKWTDWNPGYPVTPYSANSAVLNQQSGTGLNVGWQNVSPYTVSKNYVCEVASCDTEKYCS